MPIGLSNSCKITLVILESMPGWGVAVAWRTWDAPAVSADVAEASSTGPAGGVAVTAREGVAEGEFAVLGLRNAGKEIAALFCRAVDRSTPNGNKSPVIAEMSRTITTVKMIRRCRSFIGLCYLKTKLRVQSGSSTRLGGLPTQPPVAEARNMTGMKMPMPLILGPEYAW